MRKAITKPSSKKAFSIIELSIVILVASVLMAGVLSYSSSKMSNDAVKVTEERLDAIYKALGNFLMLNKRLPCPASIKSSKGVDAGYGVEVRENADSANVCLADAGSDVGIYKNTSGGALTYGAVPVRTLGLPDEMAEDGFGSKFSYFMNQDFAMTYVDGPPADEFSSEARSFPLSAYDVLQNEASAAASDVYVIKGGDGTVTLTNYAIIAVISHGQDRQGAFPANSATQNGCTGSTGQYENCVTSISTRTATFDANLTSGISGGNFADFDDIVMFKKVQNFVDDFSAMSLIPCKNTTITGGSNKDAYSGKVVYGSACGTPELGSYSARCSSYGTWVALNNCP